MRLFGNLYLVRDTGRPSDYPPRAQDELVRRRLAQSECTECMRRAAGWVFDFWPTSETR